MTEKDMLDFLRERSQLLGNEKKKIDDIIHAIESSTKILSEVSTPIPEKEPKPVKASSKKLESTTEFNPKGKLDDKISFALTTGKTGFKEEIIKVLMEMQPEQDITKLKNAVGVRLSYLLKSGMIDGRKKGRMYRYKLIKAS